ncbi:MAG: T9SS type A sorting domain-containing protein [Calditrichaeota bacterium]|nr:T9SS type A sorting domain-containing protein [Calditrichota bacterium]
MVPGSGDGVQTTGEPGYHSVQSQWIKESIDISDYAGESSVYLRFVIESDGFVEGDGWYLDDIQVLSYTTTVGVEQVDETAPNAFSLDANYPNPFNPETAIQYAVATPSQVKLTVYNMLGERVATLLDERQSSGTYVVNWNAGQFASGVYLVRMQAGAFAKSIKIVLNK